ncbi:TIGR02391 family protein [Acidithiobacillus sp. M4-SHS-6]|uniref:TIGR02391 family protein n=1 Tax=Acidithiobacillus sp. M4-SHS-6 TaxID=3383024 RepID=UPI0039BDFD45
MTINRSLLTSLQQYQKTHDKAVQLFGLFEDAEPPELLRVQQELGELATQLVEGAGLEWGQCGSLGRHLNFLSYYLKRNDKEGCSADIKDVLFYDLPATLRSLIAGATEEQYLDEKLRDAVYPLLDGSHYDSAIRKTFVVLTNRLRRAFGINDEVDGEDLVNYVFGKGGKIPVALGDSKKQALRNLISGFYGVYRNRYAHNDSEADFADARAIIEMANQILCEIEAVADASAKEA